MLNNNETIVIRRVGNGFQVSPDYEHGRCISLADVMVFQDLGYASSGKDQCKPGGELLTWLADHFADPVDKPKP